MGGPNSRKAQALWHTGCAHRQQLPLAPMLENKLRLSLTEVIVSPKKSASTTLVRRFSCEHSTEE